ncbi:Hypothetical protein CINCED_3A016607 [Cinara cedri]|uniref:Uncharacterized protein n=1 Tax=Cinara cedri TaxID=506608 RepID=A0A5E4M9T5_9HEMI|nr:Hypothetical protein CINCED_3A016607 [Cinara cedri]
MRENRLRWFGLVVRKEGSEEVRTVMKIDVGGKGKRKNPKNRRLDTIERELRTAAVYARMMWQLSGSLGRGWPTSRSRDEGEGEEED